MHRILAFFLFILNAGHCFSTIEKYIEQEFERNREQYGCIKNLDFGFKSTDDFIQLSDIGLNLILEKKEELISLESLNLSGNNIPEILTHNFIEKLVFLTPNLKKINLSYNRIGFLGASIIGNVCRQWEHLEALYLCHANINSDGLLSLFIKLSKHPHIKHLDIASNAPLDNDYAYKLGHRFAAFQNLNSISFKDLGLNDALMDEFLLGIDDYKIPGPMECDMRLKSIDFGNDLKSLDKVFQFMSKLDHTYQFDFYCRNKKYTINKENHNIKTTEKYSLKIFEHKDNKNTKMIKQKHITKHRSML